MKTKNKVFVWKIIQFILVIIVFDLVLGNILSTMYFAQKKGNYATTNEGIYRTRADVLVFGSSNAVRHFVPQVIRERTGLDAFHLGREGLEIIYHNAIFHCVLKRYTPKIVFLSLTPIELSSNDSYDRLSALLPYARQFDHVKKAVKLRGKFESLKMLSRIYPYNSMLLTLFNGFFSLKKTGSWYSQEGYKPLYGTISITGRKLRMIKDEHDLDPNRVAALRNFMESAKMRGIKLVVVFTPWYYPFPKETMTIKTVNKLAGEFGIAVFDYLTAKKFNGRSDLFWDEGHLNHTGAVAFTRDVCDRLKEDF